MGKSRKRYEEIEHTADVRLKFFGSDERDLFENAAFGLFDSIVDLAGVREEFTDTVEATGGDVEETLVNFLSELLYRFEGEKRVYRDFRISQLAPERVTAACRGERFDPRRHTRKKGIKAVTFHDVTVARSDEGLSVVVTFDV